MRRGDLVTVAARGDYGKPRPAVIVQSDALDAADSVLVVLLTSVIAEAPFYRLTVVPTNENGLAALSQVMVDKVLAFPRVKCGRVIGRLSATDMVALTRMLSVMIGLAD